MARSSLTIEGCCFSFADGLIGGLARDLLGLAGTLRGRARSARRAASNSLVEPTNTAHPASAVQRAIGAAIQRTTEATESAAEPATNRTTESTA